VIALSDINMPVMDGLTLLGLLNESHPILKTVVVSAYGDMNNIRTAMNRGAFDFICKPLNFNDLETTLEKDDSACRSIKGNHPGHQGKQYPADVCG
jgi:adenylate cyclase